ncbi:hypothetical protein [Pedococcus bigeumensis]|uniref:hypothetical protein n=1 Tax=Pedococcus bigeumensis TaxID=433644 RepID=UPI002FE74373
MPTNTSTQTTVHHHVAVAERPLDGAEFVARLRTNPGLAASQLMSLHLSASYDPQPLRDRRAHALDREHAPVLDGRRPRQLGGDVTLRRNSTSSRPTTPAGPDLAANPTRSDLAALLAGEELTHELLATGLPDTLAEQANTIGFHLARVTERWAGSGLDRRGPMFAEAAARYLTTWCQPAHLDFATTHHLRKWYCDTRDQHLAHRDPAKAAAATVPDGLDTSFITRPRITWMHPDGPAAGLLLDRFHTANRDGAIARDQWAHRKVAADLTDVAAFLTPAAALADDPDLLARAVLGVRVLTHRAPNAGVHFIPTFRPGHPSPVLGSHHPVGRCAICASTPLHPTPTRAPRPTATATGTQVQA